MDATMHYSVLGTVRAVRGDNELDPGPPKRLALLSLLVLRAPGPVSLHDAVDVLWDDEPPASAANVIHRHIGALRRLLEPGSHSRTAAGHLARAADGYRLLLDASSSDLIRFRDLRARAQSAAKRGDVSQAAEHFTAALGLWRSPVVADGTQVARHPAFTSVGHEFVATVKEAADVVLTGAPASTEEVLTALRRATGQHPYDEALHSRIIAALAMTGRQAEARAQFESIRRVLADDLGVDPGPELRAARQRFLRPGSSTRTEQAPRAGTPGAPAHLPPEAVPFVGRREVLDRCREFLPPRHVDPVTATTVAVGGMPGVGKTTLAVHLAHAAADHFPDGRIYVDLQGHHPTRAPLTTAQATRAVLDALGVGRGETYYDDTALGTAYRTALAGRRLLLVLDDALDCEQVRPLLAAAAGSGTLVTSRRRLEGLAVTHDAHLITLEPMNHREGVSLLERRLGTDRLQAEQSAAHEVTALCDGLPLALAVAGTRASTRPGISLSTLASELREGLVALSSRDSRIDARSVFQRSYDALSGGAATLFRLLSLYPSSEFTLRGAASLTGTDLRSARQNLAELTDHHLLVETAAERYAGHALLRAYAADVSAHVDTSEVRAQAYGRMLEHYLYSADAATALLTPHRTTVVLPPPRPGVRPQEFSDRTNAADWLAAERRMVSTLVRGLELHPQGVTFRERLKSMLETPAPRG
ncbi:BTAD domain-containing putative transcriptional regulator [Streptomyces sp. NPDC004082]|uniref:AfsR/SARP family transcriptional regulator n=1 Tax=Streptomyces sp. NPDC005496 TaxID=3364716 RepID=UPI003673A7BA